MSFLKKVFNSPTKVLDPVGDLINGLTGVNAQTDKTYKQQMSAMEAQNAYNTYMWNLANQYNTPAAQLARMRDAGIDVNPTSYALGTGNLSNTASVVSSDNGFAGSGSPAGNPISMAMGVASGIQGIRESKARTELDVANKDNLESRTKNTALENEIMSHNLQYAKDHRIPVNYMPSPHQQLVSSAGDVANVLGGYVDKGVSFIKKLWK